MIEHISQIMGEHPVQLHGDIRVRLDPDLGLVLIQGDGNDENVIFLDSKQLAHMHRLSSAMLQLGRPEVVSQLPEEYRGWSGL